jgi:ABC-type branched-subunit amino acid transport system substrate-binding protein
LRQAQTKAPPIPAPSGGKTGGGTIKIGVPHSLSGTMAISETTLKDVMLMLIAEQNKNGDLLGKKLEPVVVDPASNSPLFAEKARQLLSVDKCAAVFGCWTSVSHKSVLPVFEELNGLLFYPVRYEAQECSCNVFYTGAAPNQQAVPAVDYLMSERRSSAGCWVLAGTDYVYPRTTNQILEAYLKLKGAKPDDILINYTPFGHSDWQNIVAQIKKFGTAGKKTAVVSTNPPSPRSASAANSRSRPSSSRIRCGIICCWPWPVDERRIEAILATIRLADHRHRLAAESYFFRRSAGKAARQVRTHPGVRMVYTEPA